jgi:ABC-type multidrug transport system ATPase subunit
MLQIIGVLTPLTASANCHVASGCGKTTLLKCIIGQLYIDDGLIRVMGKQPLTPGHGIPGPLIGYTPQETALYPEFSVKETFKFFALYDPICCCVRICLLTYLSAHMSVFFVCLSLSLFACLPLHSCACSLHANLRLNNMSDQQLTQRKAFLLDLLNIGKHENDLVGQLSGGEQRRVSLAVALLHSPPLLVLDEPTVGLDPLLRAKLWQYLRTLVQVENVTILMTTHYIEEARQSDLVGMMRGGQLLAEGPPETLITTFGLSNLEAVFLELCKQQSTVLDQLKSADADMPDNTKSSRQMPRVKSDGTLLRSQSETQFGCCKQPKHALKRQVVKEEFHWPQRKNVQALLFKNTKRLL